MLTAAALLSHSSLMAVVALIAFLWLARASMAGEVDIGTGTSVVFGTSGFSAQLLDVSGPGFKRESVPTFHMGTTADPGAGKAGSQTHMPVDLVDPGELSMEIHFNPSTTPPLHKVAESITITFPVPAGLTNPATWVGSGFITSYEPKIPLEGKMTGSLVVKLTGPVTITAAS